MRDLFVRNNGGVVEHGVTGLLGEIWCHDW